ncbi:uncharacterized protein CLIB1444_10S02542 [[Candida] jaroonii]|uniref:Uncharacterized protein n=1 Tax=[Candida] jaroonii TaxID=467808 RepID=A0ACA9YDF7_9ASCO|nr:uncharacterized protein CLIB1444_10S02542 [[Candida] jaroonii]
MFNPIESATPEYSISIPELLPHSRVYQIQVGDKLFKISGASLSSDGPSYFTKFFGDNVNADKTLFIDRSPVVFEKIYNHLQGYAIDIETDYLYKQVFLDAMYFSLPKLADILTREYGVYARIGEKSFCVPKHLLNTPGNSPNYFTINNDDFTRRFQVVEKHKLIRPPPTRPISVPHRSSLLFTDVIELLKGNTSVIRDDNHRALLIKECKYYRFLELEQKLIKCKIINNPYNEYQEISINLNDISKKGLSLPQALPSQEVELQYQRPYIAKEPKRDLIFTIEPEDGFDVRLFLNKTLKVVTTKFSKDIYYKIEKLFRDFIPPKDFLTDDSDPTSPTVMFITTLRECHCTINGLEMRNSWLEDIFGVQHHLINEGLSDLILKKGEQSPPYLSPELSVENPKKRRLSREVEGDIIEFRIIKGSWKISAIDNHPKLIGVDMVASSDLVGFYKSLREMDRH